MGSGMGLDHGGLVVRRFEEGGHVVVGGGQGGGPVMHGGGYAGGEGTLMAAGAQVRSVGAGVVVGVGGRFGEVLQGPQGEGTAGTNDVVRTVSV